MSFIHYDVRDRVAEILLDHAPANALTEPMIDELLAALARAASDSTARAVIIGSALPRCFCAGLDLKVLAAANDAQVHALVEKLYVRLTDAQFHLGKPSIAAVTGAARGGGMTIAISCDMIVAGRSASFGYPEIDVGLIPAIHYAHLPRVVGRHRAFDLLFTAHSFSTEEAASLGLVSRIADDSAVLDEARRVAQVLAAKPPETMKLARAAFMNANYRDYRRSIAIAVENFCMAASTGEAREGIKAFIEKRAPDWSDDRFDRKQK